jgi:hypothetical protein
MRRSATVTWPLTARAQQPRKVPTIGFLGAGTSSIWSQWTAAFVQRLRELGWVEGRGIAGVGSIGTNSLRSESVTHCRQPGSSIATPSRAKLFHEEPEAGKLHIRDCEG